MGKDGASNAPDDKKEIKGKKFEGRSSETVENKKLRRIDIHKLEEIKEKEKKESLTEKVAIEKIKRIEKNKLKEIKLK